MATLHTQKSNQTLSTTGTRLQKATVISDLQLAAGKLKFIYDMWVAKFDRDEVLTGIIYSQDREFWYLETAKLTKEHTTSVNEDFARGLGDNFYDLGMELGSSISGTEITVELYKFNETLSRLFCHQQPLSTTSTRKSELLIIQESLASHASHIENIDSTLLIKTISKLLIMKLDKLSDLISTMESEISQIESKLIDDILRKNISERVLHPYHSMLYSKALDHIHNIY